MNDGTITSSPGPTSERAQGERDRVGAVGDADGVLGAEVARELCLERLDLRAENVGATVEHAGDAGVELGSQGRQRPLSIEQRYRHMVLDPSLRDAAHGGVPEGLGANGHR